MAYLSDFSNSAPSSGNFPSTSSGNFPSSNFASGDYQRHFEDVDQSLSCAVCLVRFTEPRLLACNHTFCKICLEKILEEKAKDVDREKDQFGTLSLNMNVQFGVLLNRFDINFVLECLLLSIKYIVCHIII